MSDAAVWSVILSDLLINLAAGWLGVVSVRFLQYERFKQADRLLLTVNLSLAIFALILAFELRRKGL